MLGISPGRDTLARGVPMRVIIRFSLNRDTNSKLRNDLKAILEKHGIVWSGAAGHTKTATYEGEGISESDLQKAVLAFWKRVQALSSAHIDHFWMYTDTEVEDKVRRRAALRAQRMKRLGAGD
jgi:hypothetical protein